MEKVVPCESFFFIFTKVNTSLVVLFVVQDEGVVPVHTPPASRPLRLTRSQVTAFENVERLQADIEAHMQSLVEGGEGEGEDGEDQRAEARQKSPVRSKSNLKFCDKILFQTSVNMLMFLSKHCFQQRLLSLNK